jgi:sugar lactone lactonase YvrE
MRVPNYRVFDDAGNLFVSDSGEWGKKNGWIWKIAPGGAAAIWDESACGFTNGMCLSADGKALCVVDSSPPLISKVAIRPDGTAGERTVLVELRRQVALQGHVHPDRRADEQGPGSLYSLTVAYRPETNVAKFRNEEYESLIVSASAPRPAPCGRPSRDGLP